MKYLCHKPRKNGTIDFLEVIEKGVCVIKWSFVSKLLFHKIKLAKINSKNYERVGVMKKKSHIFRGIAGIFLAFTLIFSEALVVATNWSAKVNELLGVAGDEIIRSDNKDDYYFLSDYDTPEELIAAEIALNTRLQTEGSVVLKGQPAIEGTKITLFGMRSEKMQYGGSMGGLIENKQVVPLAEALEENGFSVNPDMIAFYKEKAATYAPQRAAAGNCTDVNVGTSVNEVPKAEYLAMENNSLQEYKDAAIVVLGRDAGEAVCFYPGEEGTSNPEEFSQSTTGNILSLSNEERDLIQYVKDQGFEKIVVLLNTGSAMEIEELKDDAAIDCIMWIGNPGCYGTYGIAQLLNGSVLPSGHLADTFAVNSALAPAMRDYGAYVFANADEIDTSGNNALRGRWYLVEEESIYIGYKYYETRYFDAIMNQGNASTALTGETIDGGNVWNYDDEVSYSFGYGVEGSTFKEEITNTSIDWTGETESTVTVKVTNIGDKTAKHVVQLYVSLPYTEYDKTNGIEKSAIQLVGYAKTGESQEKTFEDVVLLEPNASEEVTISFKATDLYSYDKTREHDGVKGAYILEAGTYYFATGNGAHDAVQAVLVENHPERMTGITPTGTVYTAQVNEEIVLTESNGTLIQNRLDDADLNYYNCGTSVTYLTRNDWAGTFPKGIESITATEEMITLLKNEFYDADAELKNYTGPTEFTYDADNGIKAIELRGLSYDDPMYEKLLSQMSLQEMIDVYCANIYTMPSISLKKEQGADSPLGILFTIGKYTDGTIYEVAEDDPAKAHHTNVYVSEVVVASTFSELLASEEGRLFGNDSIWTGCNTWNAPGLNIHRHQYNGRNYEYYSEDPVLTGNTGAAIYEATNAYGLVAIGKHYAFNDQETNRDGVAVFITEQAARENELRGFEIAIRDGNAQGLMTTFNRIGCVHVGASQNLMNGILCGEWGFDGFIITDSVKSPKYFLPSECLLASNHRMLGGSNNGEMWGYTVENIQADPVLQAGIREAVHHYLYAVINSNNMNGITVDTQIGASVTWWDIALKVAIGVCAGLFILTFALFVLHDRKEEKDLLNGTERKMGRVALILELLAVVLFFVSYTTGYYTFGEMNSIFVLVMLAVAIIVELISLIVSKKDDEKFWKKLLSFVVIALLAFAATMLMGDRVEGIGNCIVTDYDSGHGGEEAIYLSIASSALMLLGIVAKSIGNFSKSKNVNK